MEKRELKLTQVLNCHEAIGILINKNVDLSADIGFDIALTLANIEKPVAAFHKERDKLVAKYGTEQVEGSGKFAFEPANREKFQTESEKLAEKIVEVEVLNKVEKSALKGVELPLRFYTMFKPFIA